jgi:hypothetical protein
MLITWKVAPCRLDSWTNPPGWRAAAAGREEGQARGNPFAEEGKGMGRATHQPAT